MLNNILFKSTLQTELNFYYASRYCIFMIRKIFELIITYFNSDLEQKINKLVKIGIIFNQMKRRIFVVGNFLWVLFKLVVESNINLSVRVKPDIIESIWQKKTWVILMQLYIV